MALTAEKGNLLCSDFGRLSRGHLKLKTFNGNIGHNEPALFLCKNKIYISIKAASNYQKDPITATVAVCWKDNIVILQYQTVRSASEVSPLDCSNIHTEVWKITKQAHTLTWIPQSLCIQRCKA